MRNIKFRVWCKNKNEWEKDLTMITPNGVLVEDHFRYGIMSVSSETHMVQFFIGLKDSNGKEIYEGDIVKIRFGVACSVIERIEWLDREARFRITNYSGGYDTIDKSKCEKDFEVIGNIYENPELLEKEII